MDGFNKKTSIPSSSLPPLPPSLGRQTLNDNPPDVPVPPPSLPPLAPSLGRMSSDNNSHVIPLPPPSHEANGDSRKGKAVVVPSETTDEPKSQLSEVVEIPDDEVEDANKRLKRILASRQYSQRYRMKQMQHVGKLELQMRAFQMEISVTAPKVRYMDQQNLLIRAENEVMRLKINAYAGKLGFKQAQYEELLKERNELLELYHFQQAQKQAAETAAFLNPTSGQVANLGLAQSGSDQMAIADQFNGFYVPYGGQKMMNQFGGGPSLVDMNTNMNNLNHADISNMENPLDMINDGDDDAENPAGFFAFKFI